MTGSKPKRRASFHAVSDQIFLDKCLANIETDPIVLLTSEQLFVPDVVAGITIHFEVVVGSLVLRKLTKN